MNVCIVLVTYNRLEYTRKTIARLLEDPSEEFELYIWDNASTDGTPEYLKEEVKDPRIVEVVLSKENVGQTRATNYAWSKTKAELVGKLDNDCLVTPGWTRILGQAHADIPELGVVACWHLRPDEFDYDRAKHKIQTFGKHQIFRHPWTCGTGLLLKRDTFERLGPMTGNTTTQYWLKMASAGYINGYYYPLVYQEHMDYPWSEHYAFAGRFEEGLEVNATSKSHGIRSVDDTKVWHQVVLKNILDDPWQVEYYVGWRAKLRRIKNKVKKTLLGGVY